MEYRFYLLDEQARVHAGESFTAAEDREALHIAAWAHFACNDEFPRYEVWRGTTCLFRGEWLPPRDLARFDLDSIVARHQENILDLEDRLQRAFLCVNRSRKLLEVSARLRRL